MSSAQDRRASFARRAESLMEKRYAVNTEKSGEIIVTVQGDLSQQEKRAVFLTVHDLGTNHSSFEEFVNSACMIEIKERSCFIHIDVPGHADNAPNLADQLVGDNPDKEKIVSEFQSRLHSSLNSKNLKQYVKAFMSRKDLPLKNCKVDCLLITGIMSPYASVVEKLYKDLNKEKVTLLKVERAGDVLADAPAKVAQSILLFCKGQGLLTSVAMPGVDRNRAFSTSSSGSTEGSTGARRLSRGMSMEDYDKPNIRRLSVTINEQLPPIKK
uniref:N-myc downstream regulated n=1 Tax=Anopheles coluzzii TaxID=1518534 RepID=A0A6E8VCL9_ANOCL